MSSLPAADRYDHRPRYFLQATQYAATEPHTAYAHHLRRRRLWREEEKREETTAINGNCSKKAKEDGHEKNKTLSSRPLRTPFYAAFIPSRRALMTSWGWLFDVFTITINMSDVVSDLMVCYQFGIEGDSKRVWFGLSIASLVIGNLIFCVVLMVHDTSNLNVFLFGPKADRYTKWQRSPWLYRTQYVIVFLIAFPLAQLIPIVEWFWTAFTEGKKSLAAKKDYRDRINHKTEAYANARQKARAQPSSPSDPPRSSSSHFSSSVVDKIVGTVIAEYDRIDMNDGVWGESAIPKPNEDNNNNNNDDDDAQHQPAATAVGQAAVDGTAETFDTIGRFDKALREHLQTHIYFYIETAVESIPQVIIQLLAITFTQEITVIQVVSMGTSLLSIVSKGYVVSASRAIHVIIFKFFCCAADLFSLFYIFASVADRLAPQEVPIIFIEGADKVQWLTQLFVLKWFILLGVAVVGIIISGIVMRIRYWHRSILQNISVKDVCVGFGLSILAAVLFIPALIALEACKWIGIVALLNSAEKTSSYFSSSALLYHLVAGYEDDPRKAQLLRELIKGALRWEMNINNAIDAGVGGGRGGGGDGSAAGGSSARTNTQEAIADLSTNNSLRGGAEKGPPSPPTVPYQSATSLRAMIRQLDCYGGNGTVTCASAFANELDRLRVLYDNNNRQVDLSEVLEVLNQRGRQMSMEVVTRREEQARVRASIIHHHRNQQHQNAHNRMDGSQPSPAHCHPNPHSAAVTVTAAMARANTRAYHESPEGKRYLKESEDAYEGVVMRRNINKSMLRFLLTTSARDADLAEGDGDEEDDSDDDVDGGDHNNAFNRILVAGRARQRRRAAPSPLARTAREALRRNVPAYDLKKHMLLHICETTSEDEPSDWGDEEAEGGEGEGDNGANARHPLHPSPSVPFPFPSSKRGGGDFYRVDEAREAEEEAAALQQVFGWARAAVSEALMKEERERVMNAADNNRKLLQKKGKPPIPQQQQPDDNDNDNNAENDNDAEEVDRLVAELEASARRLNNSSSTSADDDDNDAAPPPTAPPAASSAEENSQNQDGGGGSTVSDAHLDDVDDLSLAARTARCNEKLQRLERMWIDRRNASEELLFPSFTRDGSGKIIPNQYRNRNYIYKGDDDCCTDDGENNGGDVYHNASPTCCPSSSSSSLRLFLAPLMTRMRLRSLLRQRRLVGSDCLHDDLAVRTLRKEGGRLAASLGNGLTSLASALEDMFDEEVMNTNTTATVIINEEVGSSTNVPKVLNNDAAMTVSPGVMTTPHHQTHHHASSPPPPPPHTLFLDDLLIPAGTCFAAYRRAYVSGDKASDPKVAERTRRVARRAALRRHVATMKGPSPLLTSLGADREGTAEDLAMMLITGNSGDDDDEYDDHYNDHYNDDAAVKKIKGNDEGQRSTTAALTKRKTTRFTHRKAFAPHHLNLVFDTPMRYLNHKNVETASTREGDGERDVRIDANLYFRARPNPPAPSSSPPTTSTASTTTTNFMMIPSVYGDLSDRITGFGSGTAEDDADNGDALGDDGTSCGFLRCLRAFCCCCCGPPTSPFGIAMSRICSEFRELCVNQTIVVVGIVLFPLFIIGQLYSLLFPFLNFGLYFSSQNLLQYMCFLAYASSLLIVVLLGPATYSYQRFMVRFYATFGSTCCYLLKREHVLAIMERQHLPTVGAMVHEQLRQRRREEVVVVAAATDDGDGKPFEKDEEEMVECHSSTNNQQQEQQQRQADFATTNAAAMDLPAELVNVISAYLAPPAARSSAMGNSAQRSARHGLHASAATTWLADSIQNHQRRQRSNTNTTSSTSFAPRTVAMASPPPPPTIDVLYRQQQERRTEACYGARNEEIMRGTSYSLSRYDRMNAHQRNQNIINNNSRKRRRAGGHLSDGDANASAMPLFNLTTATADDFKRMRRRGMALGVGGYEPRDYY